MTEFDVTAENDCGSVKVMFGGVVHLHFRFYDYRGLQSWRHSTKHYCIEIVLDGAKIEAWYDSKQKWEAVIAAIVGAVAQ